MISVIIPAYNEEAYIGTLLGGLAEQELDEEIEVIVADAASTDRTGEVVQGFGKRLASLRIVPGGHPAVGRNNGARAANGDLFFFMDADVILTDREFLRKSAAYVRKKRLAVAAAHMRPDNGKMTDRLLTGFYNAALHAARWVRPLAAGSCMVVSRDAFRKVGGFPEDVIMSEDHDFALACSKVGRYGILPFTVTTSMRRLDKEGRGTLIWKYAHATLYRTFVGPIRKQLFEYEYTHVHEVLPRMSFVIPAYNEEAYVGACIESILNATGKHGMPEIIVVNNGSTDHTREVAASYPGVKVVDEPRKGTGWARQRGFREATGELLAYLDADCRISAGWMERVLAEFRDRPDMSALSGPYRYYDLPPFRKFMAEALWWMLPPASWVTGRVLIGGNFVARRGALQATDGFNTDIVFYGDDTDTACRLAAAGSVVFTMDFEVASSGRRLAKEGIWHIYLVYTLHHFRVLFRRRSFAPQNHRN